MRASTEIGSLRARSKRHGWRRWRSSTRGLRDNLARPPDSRKLPGSGYILISGTILVSGAVLVPSFVLVALANGADDEISPTALQAPSSLDGNTWMAFNPACAQDANAHGRDRSRHGVIGGEAELEVPVPPR